MKPNIIALCVFIAVIFGCKTAENHPERELRVNRHSPTEKYSSSDYKEGGTLAEKTKKYFTFYSPAGFETPAFYKDYTAAGIVRSNYQSRLDDLLNQSLTNNLDTNHFAAVTNIISVQLKNQRNDFLFKYIKVIAGNYKVYVEGITGGRAMFNLTTDTLLIAANAVGAATPAASTKTLWHLGAGGLAGFRASADKNLFMDQSTTILAMRMETLRKEKVKTLREKMKLAIQDYPLAEAALDLHELFESGTLTKVLQEVASAQTPTNSVSVVLSTNVAQFDQIISNLMARGASMTISNPPPAGTGTNGSVNTNAQPNSSTNAPPPHLNSLPL